MSQRLPDASEESLNIVRRRIMAITWVVTSIHGLFGAIGAAQAIGADRRSDQIILLGVSVPLAIIIYAVTVVILQKPFLGWRTTPWLVLLLGICAAGFVWVL
ncbi:MULTISPECIES: hypothetical protein [unclassified Aeromicrobium]|uniref:hypothetical protein n=1 Tax=unclassified Aeromicrobium TaxID=2633570 RepID=UPI00396B31E3